MLRQTVRVVVVDDSALARRAIVDALCFDPQIEVVGTAADPYQARELIEKLAPDVITLDLEMPRMDGLTFLKILQQHHPIPVVVISSFTPAGSATAMEALSLGAIDVLGKPDGSRSLDDIAPELAYRVKAAAASGRSKRRLRPESELVRRPSLPAAARAGRYSPQKLIVIGSSTGGVEALRTVLPRLPAGLPAIVIVQHIAASFSAVMARHLNELCAFEVREAQDGDELRAGLCLVAPGDFHLTLVSNGAGYRARLTQSPPVHYCRPSVDILFLSAAKVAGGHAVGALLTGMGVDGAAGMLALHNAGAETIAESEESCVVYGMPQAAIKLGAANQILALPRIADAIVQAIDRP